VENQGATHWNLFSKEIEKKLEKLTQQTNFVEGL